MIRILSFNRLYVLMISLMLGLAGTRAADLYVSTQGNDSNPGTVSSPLRTITKAYSLATAGTTITVMAGVYTDYTSGWGIHLGKSGTASNPIVLRSQTRGQAIVDGQNASDRNQGFYIDGSYNVVDGFEIRNCPHGGIAVYANNNRILNNEIHNNGNPASTSTNGRDGVYSSQGTSGNNYAGNSIHDNGRTGSNLDHGLYLCGQNETIINNLLFRNAATGLQVAGYTTVSNMKVYNNVVAWNGTSGIILWMSLNGVDMKNNIVYSNGRYGLTSYAAHGSGVVVDHNLFFGNSSGNYNFTAGGSDYSYTLGTSLSSDPLFVNGASAGFDPHLQANSPAIKAGVNLYSFFTTDKNGTARPSSGAWDLGAYVYGGANTAPSISAIANQTTTAGVAVGPLAFQVTDAQVAATSLTVSASSSNPTLAPMANIVLGGSGTNRTVTVQPAAGQTGTATITLQVTDGALTSSISFTLTVSMATTGPLNFASTSGIISAPFYVTNGAMAQPAYTSVSSGGRAVYGFNAPTSGNYTVSAQVNAPSTDYNSLFINIDAEPSDPLMIWDVPVTIGFAARTASWRGTGTIDANQYAPKIFYLSAGAHQLILRGREANCQIGNITIAPMSAPVANLAESSFSVALDGSTTTNDATIIDTPKDSTPATNASPIGQSVLPLPWKAIDIGASGTCGSNTESNGTYTVSGSGTIDGTADGFRFVYQALSADGEISAQINSVDSTSSNAWAGIMIRENLTGGAKCSLMSVSSDGNLRWQSRTDSSGMLTTTDAAATLTNAWVRLVRTGDNIQGYISNDGQSWNSAGSGPNLMASNIYIGLAVGSGTSGTNSASRFSNVIVVP